MERSEELILLNTSTHSSESKSSSTNFTNEDSSKDDIIDEHHDINLKDFCGSDSNLFEKDYRSDTSNNISFSSTNSSIVEKFLYQKEFDPLLFDQSLDVSTDNDLRGLFCLVLTKLDDLEEQLDEERYNYKILKKDYDNKINKLKFINNNIHQDINDIFDDLHNIDYRLVQCEQYSRRESIVISGIPESIPQSKLELTVLDILHGIGLKKVTSFEISACHRLYKKHGDKYPAKTVVRFTNRKIAEFCIFNQENLPQVSYHLQMNLRIFESLCENNNNIIKMCKELLYYEFIKDYKVIRGSIRITKPNNTKQYKIIHPEDLHKIFNNFYDYDGLYLNFD